MLALAISQSLSAWRSYHKGQHAKSSPLTEQRRRAQRSETQIMYLRGVTTGRKTTLWASPFPNTLDKMCTLREQQWASVLTSLPFYTRDSKTEIDRIPKEGRKVMKLSNVGQD